MNNPLFTLSRWLMRASCRRASLIGSMVLLGAACGGTDVIAIGPAEGDDEASSSTPSEPASTPTDPTATTPQLPPTGPLADAAAPPTAPPTTPPSSPPIPVLPPFSWEGGIPFLDGGIPYWDGSIPKIPSFDGGKFDGGKFDGGKSDGGIKLFDGSISLPPLPLP